MSDKVLCDVVIEKVVATNLKKGVMAVVDPYVYISLDHIPVLKTGNHGQTHAQRKSKTNRRRE